MKVPEVLEHLPGVGPLLGRMATSAEEPRPRRDPTLTLPSLDAFKLPATERKLGDGRTLLVRHPESRPPTGPGLSVMSFNILLGGQRREALLAYFDGLEAEGRMPDVIGLQEANVPIAVLLSARYGFHLAYFGHDGGNGARLINGKAFLTRHPLVDAAHFTYSLSDAERAAAIHRRGGDPCELPEDRGALYVRLDVEGVPVVLYNVHHTLGDSGINAHNLRQLNTLLRHREVPHAVALGDFNANTAIKRGGSWLMAHLITYDDTDTVEEYAVRYGVPHTSVGDTGVGNIADPRLRHELHVLEQGLPETIAHAAVARVRMPDGEMMTPKQACSELRSGKVPRGSEHWLRLQDIADSATLTSLPDESGIVPATGKRFDNFYASPELEPVLFEVDRSTESSDHQPVLAHYTPRPAKPRDGKPTPGKPT
ncbi:endonuclease/exonuclease/phosphatase family protein [Myxococcus sp. CA051A]|uniref:endonuclease/exonuclease/phosphatase family protein n=1 Tax=unclassified Myxococcus TaxID=2648731 RepID=UPI00157BA30A|nr:MULTISPECIES: endonuclease/exonuclease/phosphatase family protein [unclassified Myxococcus]NTX14668.1 endonuclease/exonuclease/phosphatase family protein [Myxococcus sp. CA056]NTX40429.1 endonuclease/exonuclease/phosphatase family protein [Myxococcus sp. CA033]NTX55284.1 endonuclease/exonuclease/phosphatase family protein [Myxococcus sp. CA039A]NTX67429.1 endonuclease/exonuclease/phosphatase family protein [Myxococcus sp. CA051A]